MFNNTSKSLQFTKIPRFSQQQSTSLSATQAQLDPIDRRPSMPPSRQVNPIPALRSGQLRPPSPEFRIRPSAVQLKDRLFSRLVPINNNNNEEAANGTCTAVNMQKCISTAMDLDKFLESEAMARLFDMLTSLIKEMPLPPLLNDDPSLSAPSSSKQFGDEREEYVSLVDQIDGIAALLNAEKVCLKGVLVILEELDRWVSDTPALIDEPQRYGNRAFRTWLDTLVVKHAKSLIKSHLIDPLLDLLHSRTSNTNNQEDESEDLKRIDEFLNGRGLTELTAYFITSFGNSVRIDYGSGHELNFLAFLTCLDSLVSLVIASATPESATQQQTATNEFYQLIGQCIFPHYLDLARRLISTYRLEPAGSHGVWGLDDHFFISYILGSSQLHHHPYIRPKSTLNRDIVGTYAAQYIYLKNIQFILNMKTGPFHEHSPMLYDISAVAAWERVTKGLVKMFIGEVLQKLPIVQHFEFGCVLPFSRQLCNVVESHNRRA